MTRSEYLEWCKNRALEYVDTGDLPQAFASFQSDMSKNEETSGHVGLGLFSEMFFGGLLSAPNEMRKFIIGFN